MAKKCSKWGEKKCVCKLIRGFNGEIRMWNVCMTRRASILQSNIWMSEMEED